MMNMKIRFALAALLVFGIGLSQTKRSVWDGVFTEEQAKRGETRYQEVCASCHGDSLEGGESAPPLAGVAFMANWNSLSVGELFDRTRSTMPQSKPGSLSREVNAEIVAFMLSANQFPAGKETLSQKSEVLKEIRIEAVKPDRKE
jgi:mono/diheme cytochrome c family protein